LLADLLLNLFEVAHPHVDVHRVAVLRRHLDVVLHVIEVRRAHVDRLALVCWCIESRGDRLADHAVARLEVDHGAAGKGGVGVD